MRYHVVIPAAGNGVRYGAPVPKQYLALAGKPVLQHAIDRMASSFPLSRICVVLAPNDCWFENLIAKQGSLQALRCGGEGREESVRNAIDALIGVEDDDWIVVHDAVRPCIDLVASLRLKSELSDDPVGGLLAIPVSDTLKVANSDGRVLRSLPRESVWRAQTPQMFRFGVLRKAFENAGVERWTDEAGAIEALGLQPRIVLGSMCNVKITYPGDLDLAAAVLSAQESCEEAR
jgi:2-C-methyl-D-erythritol 4-phosphate cytidylyltransferase